MVELPKEVRAQAVASIERYFAENVDEKIGNIAARLAAMERPENRYREVKHMGRLVAEMVHDALDAFARLDSQQAVQVARR